jgi:hypothetical protein
MPPCAALPSSLIDGLSRAVTRAASEESNRHHAAPASSALRGTGGGGGGYGHSCAHAQSVLASVVGPGAVVVQYGPDALPMPMMFRDAAAALLSRRVLPEGTRAPRVCCVVASSSRVDIKRSNPAAAHVGDGCLAVGIGSRVARETADDAGDGGNSGAGPAVNAEVTDGGASDGAGDAARDGNDDLVCILSCADVQLTIERADSGGGGGGGAAAASDLDASNCITLARGEAAVVQGSKDWQITPSDNVSACFADHRSSWLRDHAHIASDTLLLTTDVDLMSCLLVAPHWFATTHA